MAWQDYRNITDREIDLVYEYDNDRSIGLRPLCELAKRENKANPLHAKAVDACAAHLAQLIAQRSLCDANGYEVTARELKLPTAEYKGLVRKALSAENGITYKGRNLFFK